MLAPVIILTPILPDLSKRIKTFAGTSPRPDPGGIFLAKLFPNTNVTNESLPFMGYVEGDLFGVPARIFRISFSGELAYEINVHSDYGLFMWEKMMEIGKEFGIQPYGTEALSTLRIEMGHVAGPELD